MVVVLVASLCLWLPVVGKLVSVFGCLYWVMLLSWLWPVGNRAAIAGFCGLVAGVWLLAPVIGL